jgi:hypothetical protein
LVQALAVAAPKIAAPAAFAHNIREPSALHSQAGHSRVASDANRGCRNTARSLPNVDMLTELSCYRDS